MNKSQLGIRCAAITGLLFCYLHAVAEDWRELTSDREFSMALSAAPEHLRAESAVYVLNDRGFEKVRDGKNGFSCLVIRAGTVLAPTCFDAEGSRTTLLANLRRAELEADGVGPAEIQIMISSEYDAGTLKAPARPGVAYMLSTDFVNVDPQSGDGTRVYQPHLMFYAPYMTNEDIGARPEDDRSITKPWILQPGSPSAYIIVVPPEHAKPLD